MTHSPASTHWVTAPTSPCSRSEAAPSRSAEDYLVVRTPDNPLHWWGNFLLLPHPPAARADRTLAGPVRRRVPRRQARRLRRGRHRRPGRGPAGHGRCRTARRGSHGDDRDPVHEPPHPNRNAELRRLASDDDWDQLVDLRVACNDERRDGRRLPRVLPAQGGEQPSRSSARGTAHGSARSRTAGCAPAWACCGPSEGLARFQSVETHPDARRPRTGRDARAPRQPVRAGRAGRRTLVMVADPGYSAIRIYRAVGFVDAESQLQAERAPAR